MLERRLTGIGRWLWLGSAVMSVVFAVLLGVLAVVPPAEEVPLPARMGPAAGVLFCVGFAILSLRIFWRGSMDLKFDTSMIIGMVWAFVVLTVVMFSIMSLLAADRITGLWMMMFGLVLMVVGTVFLLRHVIAQSELRTREKLLEIEYRLAELAETLKPEKPTT